MKKLFLLINLAFSASYAQNSYIVDNKGTKTIVRDDAVDVVFIDKRISYVNVGKSWEKYIKFDDFDYAIVGPSLLKSFKLKHSKKSDVYFVLAEKKDKRLIGREIIVTTTSSGGSGISYTHSYSKAYDELYVIDNEENIIESLTTAGNSKKDLEQKLAPMVKNHFSDCPDLMGKLQKYDSYEYGQDNYILKFFSDTKYINCK